MLPECVQAVKKVGNPEIEVYVDGGIRKVILTYFKNRFKLGFF